MTTALTTALDSLRALLLRAPTMIARSAVDQIALILDPTQNSDDALAMLCLRATDLLRAIYAGVLQPRRGSQPALMDYHNFVCRAHEIGQSGATGRALRALLNLCYVDSILVLKITVDGDKAALASFHQSFDEIEVAFVSARERLRCGYFSLVYEHLYAIMRAAYDEVPMRGVMNLMMRVIDGTTAYSQHTALLRMRVCEDVVQRSHYLLNKREWEFVIDALESRLEPSV